MQQESSPEQIPHEEAATPAFTPSSAPPQKTQEREAEMQQEGSREQSLHEKAETTAPPPSPASAKDMKQVPGGSGASEAASKEVALKKELGLLEVVTMIMGIMIGSGIFVSPKGVIAYAGSVGVSLIVWAASGLISTVGALCFAELATMIPESGGMYSYLHEAFGPLLAFLFFWVTTIVRNAAGSAVIALTFSDYLLQSILSDCDEVPDVPRRLIAACVICFLSWINAISVKWAIKVQTFFTATKVLALIIIIVMGIEYLASGHMDNYRNPMQGTNWAASAIAFAFYQSLFSYSGWDSITVLVEEMKNGSRNVPLAIVIGTMLVTIIYTLTNVAYLAVLSPSEMLSSSAVAVSFANRTLGVLAWIMPLSVICSTFGGLNGATFTQSRLIFVGARKGHLPEAFSLLHATRCTPVTAVVLNAILCLMMLSTSDVVVLIDYGVFACTLTFFGCMCALFWFRYKQPHRSRPFKVWLPLPILFSVVQVFLMVLPLIENPVDVGVSIGVVATGLPIYFFAIYRKDIAEVLSKPLQKLTRFCQLLFMGLPDKKMD